MTTIGVDNWRRGSLGGIGRGGEHLGAIVARVPSRTGRAAKRAHGAAVEGGAEEDALTAVCAAIVVVL